MLKYPGRFTTKETYENIVLRSNPNGEILRVKDVADVEFGSGYYDIYSKLNGRPSAAIMIKQLYGSNASLVIKTLKLNWKKLRVPLFQKEWIMRNVLNFLLGRYPQTVVRDTTGILNLKPLQVAVGIPSQLLKNRLNWNYRLQSWT